MLLCLFLPLREIPAQKIYNIYWHCIFNNSAKEKYGCPRIAAETQRFSKG